MASMPDCQVACPMYASRAAMKRCPNVQLAAATMWAMRDVDAFGVWNMGRTVFLVWFAAAISTVNILFSAHLDPSFCFANSLSFE